MPNEFLSALKLDLEKKTTQSKQAYVNALADLYNELNRPNITDIREQYESIHKYLRQAIKSPDYQVSDISNEPYRKFLQALCVAKFEGNEMFAHHENFLKSKNIRYIPSNERRTSFAEQVKSTNKTLKTAPERKDRVALAIQKLEGIGLLPADNIGRSNIPEVRSYHQYKDKKITVLRHGTIAISSHGELEIAPEYLCYLDAKEAENEHVLYVNHQRCDDSQFNGMGVFDSQEKVRSNMIHHLGEKRTHFHALSLPMNGPIFRFAGEKGELKKRITESLLEQKNGFRLPNGYLIPKDQIEAMFDQTLTYFDKDKKSFNKEDTEEFLMVFYSYLKEKVKIELNIKVMATVCKDNKDRGNVSSTVDELLMAFYSGQLSDEGFLNNLHTRFFGSFMIKNEEIRPEHVHLVGRIATRLIRLNSSRK